MSGLTPNIGQERAEIGWGGERARIVSSSYSNLGLSGACRAGIESAHTPPFLEDLLGTKKGPTSDCAFVLFGPSCRSRSGFNPVQRLSIHCYY